MMTNTTTPRPCAATATIATAATKNLGIAPTTSYTPTACAKIATSIPTTAREDNKRSTRNSNHWIKLKILKDSNDININLHYIINILHVVVKKYHFFGTVQDRRLRIRYSLELFLVASRRFSHLYFVE